jgi:hypothetical protein
MVNESYGNSAAEHIPQTTERGNFYFWTVNLTGKLTIAQIGVARLEGKMMIP